MKENGKKVNRPHLGIVAKIASKDCELRAHHTGAFAKWSGRPYFNIRCDTCKVDIHPMTASPLLWANSHKKWKKLDSPRYVG